MSRQEIPAEFTLKAVATGVVLGIVFGAANAYLGLRVGMTVSASIPAAVMTVAASVCSARAGPSSRRTFADGRVGVHVARHRHDLHHPGAVPVGVAPPYLQVVVLALPRALLGLAAMIPLCRFRSST